jgi:hypothetical protein
MHSNLWFNLGADLNVSSFLSGIGMATFVTSGIFFIKFWKAARDRFFLFFAIACFLIASERVGLLLVDGAETWTPTPQSEAGSWVYLLRFLGYLMIVIAIIDKNRRRT